MTSKDFQDRLFIRVPEITARYGISRSAIYAAINRGDLRARRFRARGWLITEADARRWIERATTPYVPSERDEPTDA